MIFAWPDFVSMHVKRTMADRQSTNYSYMSHRPRGKPCTPPRPRLNVTDYRIRLSSRTQNVSNTPSLHVAGVEHEDENEAQRYRSAVTASVAARARVTISRSVGTARTRINNRIRRSPASTAK